MITRTLAELIADVRVQSDLRDSQFCTDLQITRFINEENRRLTGKLIQIYDQDWLHKVFTITTEAGKSNYALPSDCFTPKWFRMAVQSTIRQIPRAQNEMVGMEDGTGTDFAEDPYYRIQGAEVRFVPTPTTIVTVTIEYIPTAIAYAPAEGEGSDAAVDDLTDDDDYIDCRWGWEQYVVKRVAKRIKDMQEEDSSALAMEIADLGNDIKELASNRVTNSPVLMKSAYDLP